MRPLSGMIVIATVSIWTGLQATPAVGQTFNDRWSIIPKAHAEPAPEGLDQTKKDEPQAQVLERSFRRSIFQSSHFRKSLVLFVFQRQDSQRFIV